MVHREGTFTGVRHATIYCRDWSPEGEPRGALVVVHGLAEHCGRYGNLVDHFVPRGYAVHAHDHLGHGRSAGRRASSEPTSTGCEPGIRGSRSSWSDTASAR
jgi:acylglycerol lipase